MIRIMLADDQAMVRQGFGALLNAQQGMAVVGEVTNGEDAVRTGRDLRPDVVLMDVRMPVMDGLEATRRLMNPPVGVDYRPRVLMLTTFDLDDYVYEALRAGASGFLLKDATADDLVAAVRIVAAGEALLAPTVTRRLIEEFASQPRDRRHAGAGRADGQDPRRPDPHQARPPRPRPGRGDRLRERPGHPWRGPWLTGGRWAAQLAAHRNPVPARSIGVSLGVSPPASTTWVRLRPPGVHSCDRFQPPGVHCCWPGGHRNHPVRVMLARSTGYSLAQRSDVPNAVWSVRPPHSRT
jgi:DNA-binding NarL/FixJ family response regulator